TVPAMALPGPPPAAPPADDHAARSAAACTPSSASKREMASADAASNRPYAAPSPGVLPESRPTDRAAPAGRPPTALLRTRAILADAGQAAGPGLLGPPPLRAQPTHGLARNRA